MQDRSNCFIFADGAAGVVVGETPIQGIGPTVWGSDGEQANAILGAFGVHLGEDVFVGALAFECDLGVRDAVGREVEAVDFGARFLWHLEEGERFGWLEVYYLDLFVAITLTVIEPRWLMIVDAIVYV